MAKTLFTSQGRPVELGRELGKGGEGSVYDVPSSTQVAKVYHHAPNEQKQAKLRFMAATADAALLSYAAWPQDTLHNRAGGPVMGFLMPKVTGRDPIHMVYSPAHRRQERPHVAWDYLLFVARNTAAAFEAVHSHGHVLGDVNQGNILVGQDSKVVLIDSDSFQINAQGALHLCEVGVGHFTPPELQGLASFHGVTRTPNHDNFGLALLVFHLLFGGRHPYSGVPLVSHAGESLENDIKHLRYAYAQDAKVRGVAPPPLSLPMNLVPPTVEEMFFRAFTEKGQAGARPTAQQWVSVLDGLRHKLVKCATSSVHIFPNHLSACPWCAMELKGVAYFIDLGTVLVPATSGFVLAHVWALITRVQPPPSLPLPDIRSIKVTPTPLPDNIPKPGEAWFRRLAVLVGVVMVIYNFPAFTFFALIGGIVGWVAAEGSGGRLRAEEARLRRTALDTAQQEYQQLTEQLNRSVGVAGFEAKRTGLDKLRQEYEQLPQAEKHAMEELQTNARSRQLERFLSGCFIDSATIPGVGAGRKASLRSFGIETAADVDWGRVRQVRGFGEGLTRTMMLWRGECERRFTFNPAMAVTPADRQAVKTKFANRRTAIETALRQGATELQGFRGRQAEQVARLKPQLEQAARKLAQAHSDLSVL